MNKEQLAEQLQRECNGMVSEAVTCSARPGITAQDGYNAYYFMKLAELQLSIEQPDKHYGFYQLCPNCDGQKTVSRPPGTPSDVRPCSSWEASYPCDICKGEGVIPRPEIKNIQP